MALSEGGLFSKARNTTDKYKKAQKDEQELISEIGKEMNSEYVGAKVTWNDFVKKEGEDAYKVEADKSGTGEEQTFETEELGWRIWDYDGTTIRIILDKPTTKTLTLKGTAGYNNGVYLINEICRQCYGQYETDGETKKTGISVANLRRSDIEAVSNYDYTKYKHKESGEEAWVEVLDDNDTEGLIYYGETEKYEINNKAPTMWSEKDSTWNYKYNRSNKTATGNKSCKDPWEQEYGGETEIGTGSMKDMTEFTQSYYCHNYLNKKGEFKDTKYYDLLFKDKNGNYFSSSYWLAGRYVGLYNGFLSFGCMGLDASDSSCTILGWETFFSDR